jgi:GMP synthase-like glutamine amidotransferase
MKLGILDAVPAHYLSVDHGISDGQKFIDWLTEVGFGGKMTVYPVAEGQFPSTLADCDAYLVTGSPASVYDSDVWIGRLLAFIRQAYAEGIPLVGICFGHQAISQALGGHVEAAPGGWMVGLHAFEMLLQPTWMEECITPCQLYHVNQDQVMALPPGALLVGSSEQCPYSMYSIGRQVLSLQGHPEQPVRAVRNFMQDLRKVIPPTVYYQAELSLLRASPNSHLVGRWVCRFLEQALEEQER